MFKLAVTFVAAAALVLAQNTTAPSECIITCSTTALASSDCGALTNLTCICADTDFQTAVGTCIGSTCPEQLTDAIALQNAQCGNSANETTSAAGTAPATTGASTTRPATTAPTTRPATTSGSTTRPANSTTTPNSGFHTAGLASGAALALFGAAFSLF